MLLLRLLPGYIFRLEDTICDLWHFLQLILNQVCQLCPIGIETDRFEVHVAGPYHLTIWTDGWAPCFILKIEAIPKFLYMLNEHVSLWDYGCVLDALKYHPV